MKKFTLTLFVIFLGIISLFAQAPQTFKYQAVARDNLGKIIVNQIVGLRISILKDSPLGATMYMETHQRGTNDFGIVTLNVGGGTIVTGNFNTINWSNGEYFIKTELDIAGTGLYEFIGTTQLLSVPYALYANEAGKARNDNDTSATNELQTIVKTGNTVTLSQNGGNIDLTEYLDNTDNQTLNINGYNLSISNGNSINLPPDVDHDTLNEIQIISKTVNQISLSKNGGTITDSDNQSLTLAGNQLSISGGNTLTLSGAVDLDSDPTNEIQNLSIGHDTIRLSLSNEIKLPHDYLTLNNDTLELSNSNYVVFYDADKDSTNEIQLLSTDQNTLNISMGNSVIVDTDTTNEIQNLSIHNDTLYISKGNFIKLNFFEYLIPVGTIIPFAGVNPPNGWLVCNGVAINRTTYANLFNVISTSWGAGDSNATFNLPDLRGQFLRGIDGSSNIDPDKLSRTAKYFGGNTGNNVGSFQSDLLKNHTHNYILQGNPYTNGTNSYYVNTITDIKTSTTYSTGGQETRPVNAYVNFIIKY